LSWDKGVVDVFLPTEEWEFCMALKGDEGVVGVILSWDEGEEGVVLPGENGDDGVALPGGNGDVGVGALWADKEVAGEAPPEDNGAVPAIWLGDKGVVGVALFKEDGVLDAILPEGVLDLACVPPWIRMSSTSWLSRDICLHTKMIKFRGEFLNYLKGQCHEIFASAFFHESPWWCTLSCEYLREFSKKF
jgi:hypothetical protein